jgi:hypothetical protein
MSKATTAMGEALSAKGVFRHNIEFQIAISKFQNNGGEYGVALAMLNAAYGRSEGQHDVAADGQRVPADASRPGAGQPSGANKVERAMPAPGHAKRGAGSINAVQGTLAKSLFDSIVLPDGRRLRDVRWAECPMLAARYQRLGRILMACRNFAVPPDASMTLDNVVPEAELQHIVDAVERLNALD